MACTEYYSSMSKMINEMALSTGISGEIQKDPGSHRDVVRLSETMFADYPDVVGIKQIMKMLKISEDKVRRLIKKKQLVGFMTYEWLIPKANVIAYGLEAGLIKEA